MISRDEAIKIFEANDDPINWEYPKDYEYDKSIKKFKEFVNEIQVKFKEIIEFETESHIQDASYHSELYLPSSVLSVPSVETRKQNIMGKERDVQLRHGVIRFSNFGNMVTIYEEEDIKKEYLDYIFTLFDKYGYIYINSKYLNEKYTGKNPGVTGIDNWQIRYFDFV